MKLNYGENIIKSMKYGTIVNVMCTILPFILRTCIIYAMGLEYAGLNGLFTSILSMLSLAELGFGSAVVYSMYKPVAEENYEKLGAILAYFRYVYRIVGCVMFLIGLAVLPFIKYMIKGDYPGELNLYILYLGFLFDTCCSYFFMGYRVSILEAYQRIDIISLIDGIIISIGYVVQIISIILFKNYYLYLFNIILMTASKNVARAVYVKKKYPHIKCEGNIGAEEKRTISTNVSALFFSKVGAVISSAFDQLVISAFIGLRVVALYGNYAYITTAINSFVMLFFRTITGGIGNAMVLESKEEVFTRMRRYLFAINWILVWASACLLCLFQPFIEIWVGKNNVLSYDFVILMVFLFYISLLRNIVTSFKSAAGIWNEDKFRPLIAGFVNLGINIAVVKYWGVQGVVLSTIIALLFIDIPWETGVLFRNYYKSFMWSFGKYFVGCILAAVAICSLTVLSCYYIKVENIYIGFCIKGVVCTIVSNFILFLLYHRKSEFRWMVDYYLWKIKPSKR